MVEGFVLRNLVKQVDADRPGIDVSKLQEIVGPAPKLGTSAREFVVPVQYPGLPTVQDWLNSIGRRPAYPDPSSRPMVRPDRSVNDRDVWECQHMSSSSCERYMELSPHDRDYRNSLPHNDQYEFDKRYLGR